MSSPGPMTIEILADGSVKITTSKVSAAAHVRAERMLGEIAKLMDGDVKAKHGHHHHGTEEHSHDHDHQHEGQS